MAGQTRACRSTRGRETFEDAAHELMGLCSSDVDEQEVVVSRRAAGDHVGASQPRRERFVDVAARIFRFHVQPHDPEARAVARGPRTLLDQSALEVAAHPEEMQLQRTKPRQNLFAEADSRHVIGERKLTALIHDGRLTHSCFTDQHR